MSLTFAHGNVHGSYRGVRTLMRGYPDTVSVNEATRAIRLISRIKMYVEVYGENAQDRRRGPKDVVAMHRKSHNSLGQFAFYGSAPSNPDKIAPERWFSACAFRHPQFGAVCMTSLHPHAAVKGKDDSVDRVKKFDAQMRRLDAWLTFCESQGFYNLVMGDVQLTPKSSFDGLSPYEVFERHGMKHENVHIDAIGYGARHRGKQVRLQFREISKAALHSDHRGFRGALVL